TEMSQLENCIRGLLGRSVALNLTNRREEKVVTVTTTPATPVPAQEVSATLTNEETIQAPLAGQVVPLSDVPDEVFASGAMGQGVAIRPTSNTVVAPFSGSVVMIAPTKHAIGLRSTSGVEVLIHVGLETVALNGTPFTLHVEDGASVEAGQTLLTFDASAIEQHGLQTITPVIVTNASSYAEVIVGQHETVEANTAILTIVK
ncbi:PTS glucose transporter subunit IIA, partial [Exiguobacterium sp. J14376]